MMVEQPAAVLGADSQAPLQQANARALVDTCGDILRLASEGEGAKALLLFDALCEGSCVPAELGAALSRVRDQHGGSPLLYAVQKVRHLAPSPRVDLLTHTSLTAQQRPAAY